MTKQTNPYESSGALDEGRQRDRRPSVFVPMLLYAAASYYLLSCLTLPLANEVWLGELPVLAIPQLPKIWLFDLLRGEIIDVRSGLGLSRSPSQDLMAAKPLAFALLFLLPSGCLVSLTVCARQLPGCARPIILLLIAVLSDACITLWFERTSSLSLF